MIVELNHAKYNVIALLVKYTCKCSYKITRIFKNVRNRVRLGFKKLFEDYILNMLTYNTNHMFSIPLNISGQLLTFYKILVHPLTLSPSKSEIIFWGQY